MNNTCNIGISTEALYTVFLCDMPGFPKVNSAEAKRNHLERECRRDVIKPPMTESDSTRAGPRKFLESTTCSIHETCRGDCGVRGMPVVGFPVGLYRGSLVCRVNYFK